MNEKFYNLAKDKQDRMINGAIKVFAQNGYDKASTDIIIKAAGISKGLLFHYFGSKRNLYEYVTEFCARFMMMELTTGISDDEKNLFERFKLVEKGKLRMLKSYPYLDLFLISVSAESAEEVRECAEHWNEQLKQLYISIIDEKADPDLIRGNLTVDKAREVVMLCSDGYKNRMYSLKTEPEQVLEGFLPYLDILKTNFTR